MGDRHAEWLASQKAQAEKDKAEAEAAEKAKLAAMEPEERAEYLKQKV